MAILLAGPPGSGKFSARRALFQAGDEQITGGLKDSDFVTIDADTIKEQLLEAAEQDGALQNFLTPPEAKALQAQGETFSKLDFASLVHEESSIITKRCQQAAIEQRRNLILDQVCSNSAKTSALVEKLATQGYSVRVVEIHAEKAFSEESAFQRYLHDYETGEGRYVPTEVIDSVYNADGSSKPRQAIQNLLDTTPVRIDAYRRFDATEIGQPPVLTQQGHRSGDHLRIGPATPTPSGAPQERHPSPRPTKHDLLTNTTGPRRRFETSTQRRDLKPSQRPSRFAGRDAGHDAGFEF